MTLGDLVKEYREKHNISMDEFSKMCSLSKGYISMLENNTNPRSNKPIAPTLPTIKKIASAMNTDIDSILRTLDFDQEISLDSKSEEPIFCKNEYTMDTIETRIKEIIIKRYGSIKKFCKKIEMPWTTLDSILKRGIANSNITNVMKIAKELNIDTESLVSGSILSTEDANKEPPEIKYRTIETNTAVVAEEARTYGIQMNNSLNYNPFKENIYHEVHFVPIDETIYKENTESSFIHRLFKYYKMLNDIGKDVAIKRVEELTYVPEYTNEVETNTSMPLKKSDTFKSKATNKIYKNSKK